MNTTHREVPRPFGLRVDLMIMTILGWNRDIERNTLDEAYYRA